MEPQALYPRFRSYYRSVTPLFEKPRVAAYTMLVLSFFTVSIFGTFAIRPTLATIVALKKKIEDQKSVDTRMDQKINQLRLANQEYEKIRPEFEAIFEALPDKPQSAALVGKMNRVLIDNNIDITILNFTALEITRPETEPTSVSLLAFTLTGRATYDNVLSFINFLASMDRIVTIDTVDIATTPISNQLGQTVASDGLLTVTMRGKSYLLWEKPASKAGKGVTGG